MSALLKSYAAVCLSLLVVGAQQAGAQERAGVLTGKEKLAGKATDEQRVNNCKVPAGKRGLKARPDKCQPKGQGEISKAE